MTADALESADTADTANTGGPADAAPAALTDRLTADSSSEPPHEAAAGHDLTWQQRTQRVVIEWLVVLVCGLGLALLIKAFLVEVFVIPSGSMEPTLMINDRVAVYKLGYRFGDIDPGDVVVFSLPGQSNDTNDLIKRVIAVGGDTFELRDGRVHIDGERLDEPYLTVSNSTHPAGPIPQCVNPPEPDRCEVPEGMILVLGDNRTGSRDGRYFGPVDVDTVVGRAFLKIWPLNHVGTL